MCMYAHVFGRSDAGKGKGKLIVKGAGKGKGKYSAEAWGNLLYGSFPIRRQRGHPDVILPLVISNPANT